MTAAGNPIRIAHPYLIVVACVLVACARGSGYRPAEIEDTQDLIKALRDAGANVSETEMLATVDLGVTAQVHQVNQAIVYIYEYASVVERAAVSENLSQDGSAWGEKLLAWPSRVHIWTAARLIVAYPGTDGGTILLLDGLLGDPITQPPSQIDEPFPPAITAAVEFLAQRLEVNPVSIEVVRFSAETWPDACLGLPSEGEMCDQVVTSGWRILLLAGEEEYQVHTDQIGTYVRVK